MSSSANVRGGEARQGLRGIWKGDEGMRRCQQQKLPLGNPHLLKEVTRWSARSTRKRIWKLAQSKKRENPGARQKRPKAQRGNG